MSAQDDTPRDEKLTRLYRESKQAEPPAALDRAVLEAARAAVAPRPTRKASWWRRWSVPVAAFASIVLTVTLTLVVQRERGSLEPAAVAPSRDESAPLPPVSAPPAARSKMAPEVPPAVRPKVAPAIPRVDGDGAASAGKMPVPAKRAARPEALGEARPFASERQEEAPPAAVESKRQARDAAAGALSVPVAPPPAAAPAAPEAEQRVFAPPRPAAQPLRAPAAPAAAESGERGESDATAAPRRKLELRARAAPRTPQAWVEEIRELRKQGREPEAREALEAFRRAYPDYLLPEDLR